SRGCNGLPGRFFFVASAVGTTNGLSCFASGSFAGACGSAAGLSDLSNVIGSVELTDCDMETKAPKRSGNIETIKPHGRCLPSDGDLPNDSKFCWASAKLDVSHHRRDSRK